VHFHCSNSSFENFIFPVRRYALGKGHEMLVPIQFPDDFDVARFRKIEVGYLVKSFATPTLAMHAVTVPIDGGAIVQILVPEQVEAVLADSPASLKDLLSLL
jgi:hypothetical protein